MHRIHTRDGVTLCCVQAILCMAPSVCHAWDGVTLCCVQAGRFEVGVEQFIFEADPDEGCLGAEREPMG